MTQFSAPTGAAQKRNTSPLSWFQTCQHFFGVEKPSYCSAAQGRIWGEYQRYLTNFDLGHRLLRSAERANRIAWRSDHLSAKATRLLDADGFDPADYPFLAVCHKISGIYGTTEEKHLRPARRKLVKQICTVSIVSLPELHEQCSRIRELG